MTSPRPFRAQWFYKAIIGSFLAFSAGCGEEQPGGTLPTSALDGIWMLNEGTRVRKGTTVECRPMLMEVEVYSTAVVIGQRAFPCEFETFKPNALALERRESELFFGGDRVGSLLERSMDITLPGGERRISWDLDRPDAPWQEVAVIDGVSTEYSAKLQSRPDDTPVAFFTTLTFPEDTPADGRVVVASRPERATSFRIIAGPQSGFFLSFDTSTGVFRIIPDANFFGRVSFRFEATSDGISQDLVSNDADVDIDFTAVPDPPVADRGSVTVFENSTQTFDPAFDPDGDSLTYTIVTPPMHGTATAGAFIAYTPETGFSGTDSMVYTVSDGTTTVGPAFVEIFVGPVDDIPVVHDQDLEVTSGSATRVALDVIDPDSPNIEYWWDDFPTFGDFRGGGSNYVYVPHPGVQQATEDIHFRVFDGLNTSQSATLHITISPGSHPCTLLTSSEVTAVYPELTIGDKLYFRAVLPPTPQQFVMVTDGTQFGATIAQFSDSDTFGFDNNVGGNRRTTFFNVQSTTFFTTSTNTYASRLFAQTNLDAAQVVNDIPAPATNLAGEPAVGDAYVEGSAAYLPIHWPTTTGQYLCQLWKIDSLTSQTSLFKTFPEANSPCFGLWPMAGQQYMFVGTNLYKFSGLQSAPVLVADLGNALPEPWMVEAGGKIFFQTRTAVGLETQIDLWVTDGTTNGTKVVKQLETASLEFDVFSPVAFLNKLYFAHRKSLWMSDGTDAGTQIVATMPVGSAVGNGAIGKISVGNGKLFFLANSDAAGREPWVSDGTTAGTQMLKDIQTGVAGSSLPSTNPMYFHAWNGQMLFSADDGSGSGLWSTDGTPNGTNLVERRAMVTIAGVIGNNVYFHDGHFFYTMPLP